MPTQSQRLLFGAVIGIITLFFPPYTPVLTPLIALVAALMAYAVAPAIRRLTNKLMEEGTDETDHIH